MPDVLRVEVLTAAGCAHCKETRARVQKVVAQFAPRAQYREVNVIEELDYAVRLGVLTTPCVAIGGELAFVGPPSEKKLATAIRQRIAAR